MKPITKEKLLRKLYSGEEVFLYHKRLRNEITSLKISRGRFNLGGGLTYFQEVEDYYEHDDGLYYMTESQPHAGWAPA